MRLYLISALSLFALLLSLAACSPFSSYSQEAESEEPEYVPGEVIVFFTVDGTGAKAARDLIADIEGVTWKKTISAYPGIDLKALIGVPEGEEQEWIERLGQEPLIDHAGLNHRGYTTDV